MILFFVGFGVFPGFSQGGEDIERIIRADIKEKALMSGTLDLYDSKIDQVRNLSLLEIKESLPKATSLKFRDMSSGAIVTVTAQLREVSGSYVVNGYKILKVEELKKKNVASREYADVEVQSFMMNYLKNQAKFSGYFNMYDEKNSKLRKLKPLQFQAKVRKFGILFISRVECTDVESNEKLEIDVTVENKEGALKVKSMRIFSIHSSE